jgi:endonuclease/exonuclease/phosphatase family metal-dependent hydrolase
MNRGHRPSHDKKPRDFFSVLTLNLRFGLADDGKNSWDNRKKGFPALFRQFRPDFIGFQEANDFQIDFLADILTEYNYIGKRRPAPKFWQNNIIFYKNIWEATDSRHFFLSPTPSIPSRFRESRWPRQCTLGMFQKKDRALLCINTHFDFETVVQTRSAGIIMDCLATLPADVPTILLGDFNANPSHACHRVFTGESRRYQVKGDCFKNVFEQPFPGTYHGFAGKPDGDHIDWILYRGEIDVDAANVIRQLFEGIYPSDHYPIFVRFSWK